MTAGGDLSDAEWAAIAPSMPPGRKAVVESQRRIVQDAAQRFEEVSRKLAEAARGTSENMRRLMTLPNAAEGGLRDLQQGMTGLIEGVVQTNLRAAQELFRLASPAPFVELQQRFAREHTETMLRNGAALVRAVRRTADDTLRPLEEQIAQQQCEAANQSCMQRTAKKATAPALREGIQMHIEQTQAQIERVEQALEKLDARPGRKVCEAMRGLVEEAQHELEEHDKGPILDLVIVAGMQRIEHYEIAAYGTDVALAKALGETEVMGLLSQTLEEEKQTDLKLTKITEQHIMADALAGGSASLPAAGGKSGSGGKRRPA